MRGSAQRRVAADTRHTDFLEPRKIRHRAVLAILALAAGITAIDGAGTPPARAQQIPGIDARIVAHNIPGAATRSQAIFQRTSSPEPCSTPAASWSAARQTSARRFPPAADWKARSYQL